MHSQKDCEEKIQDYVRLMDEARKNINRAKDMRAQFLQEAIAYNEANKKNILSIDELVKTGKTQCRKHYERFTPDGR